VKGGVMTILKNLREMFKGREKDNPVRESAPEVSHLPIDQLPSVYREMAEVVGLKNTLELAIVFGGRELYFPKLNNVLRVERDKKILTEYAAGSTADNIAKKYGITAVRVCQIIKLRRPQ